jgi:two-component system sensor histidine kinase BaeS
VTRGTSLRTRLVAAFVLVALVVLALSGAATYLLVRRSLQQRALDDMRARTSDLAAAVQAAKLQSGVKQRFRIGVRLLDLQPVLVGPGGAVLGGNLPSPLRPSDIDPAALLAGNEVSGRRGNTVFLALPTGRNVGRASLIVVATDTVDLTVLHRAVPLMIAIGVVVLGGVVLLSIWLARRLTRPLREIERAAGQLATGDLSARADIPPSADDELTTLANTLNAMASQLEASRGSERAFLLSISHDLRTPLTSIRGYAEALADGTLDDAAADDRKRAATVIGAEARRLERLVRDLLDLARLDAHQFSLQTHPCDAQEITRESALAFEPQARELGIELAVAPAGSIPAELDAERLGQIVANLVENALKYATTRVDVAATRVSPARFELVVRDDGPGIAPDQLAMVFDRLYTVRDTPGRSVGTGLGLAIVRELATAMGGSACARATDRARTEFVVSLPSS